MKTFTSTLIGAACIASAVQGIELAIQEEADSIMLAQVEGCGD